MHQPGLTVATPKLPWHLCRPTSSAMPIWQTNPPQADGRSGAEASMARGDYIGALTHNRSMIVVILCDNVIAAGLVTSTVLIVRPNIFQPIRRLWSPILTIPAKEVMQKQMKCARFLLQSRPVTIPMFKSGQTKIERQSTGPQPSRLSVAMDLS